MVVRHINSSTAILMQLYENNSNYVCLLDHTFQYSKIICVVTIVFLQVPFRDREDKTFINIS